MAYTMPASMTGGGGAFGGGAGSTGGMPSFSTEGGLMGGAGEMAGGFDIMSLFSGMGGGMPGMGGKKPEASAPPPPLQVKDASPIPIALNLPTALQIQKGFPSVTAQLFGGMRG